MAKEIIITYGGGGTGYFKSYNSASWNSDSGYMANKFNKVPGTNNFPVDSDQVASQPGRFCIARIREEELGFCIDKRTNTILQVLPGRYFFNEFTHLYIGKLPWQQPNYTQPLNLSTHFTNATSATQQTIQRQANRIKVIVVPNGQLALVRDQGITYTLEANDQPYILTSPTVAFTSYQSENSPVIGSNHQGYTRVNLQPDTLVTFRHKTKNLAWFSKNTDPEELKSLTFAAPNASSVNVHSLTQNHVREEHLTVVNLQEQQFAFIKDINGKLRVVEGENGLNSFILRAPAELIDIQNKNEPIYPANPAAHGFTRVRIPHGSCAVVININKGGKVELYPPLCTNEPYYFDGQSRKFVQTVSMSEAETHIDMPEINSKISIVNLRTDEIGIANLGNGVCFLKPRMQPYIFVPPLQYIRTEHSNQPIIKEGDLYRIALEPQQIAAISHNGKLKILKQDGQDNCWHFRSDNLKIYGPKDKTEKLVVLGTRTFIRVDPGEVGYYIISNDMQILKPGLHELDSGLGQIWKGIYRTSVEPLEINDIQVAAQGGTKLHIDVFVTYSITDPSKTIEKFGQRHEDLVKYLEDITKAEMLKLCKDEPAMGSHKFNISGQDGAGASSFQGGSSDSNQEQEDQLQQDFTKHVKTLEQECGVRVTNMQILKWSPDPEFMGMMKEQALQLQEQQAGNAKAILQSEQASQQLAAQKEQAALTAQIEQQQMAAANEKAKLQKQGQEIQLQLKRAARENEITIQTLEQTAQAQRTQAEAVATATAALEIQVATAKAQADTKAAEAEASARAQQAQAEADSKSAELTASTKVIVAEQAKAQLLIEAKSQKEAAILKAESTVAAKTAEQKAEAMSAKEVAQAKMDTAELEAGAIEITTKSSVIKAQAETDIQKLHGAATAESTAALKEAEFAHIPKENRTEVIKAGLVADSMQACSKATQIVQHTTDPQDMQRAVSGAQVWQQMQQLMQVPDMMGNQAIRATNPRAFPSVTANGFIQSDLAQNGFFPTIGMTGLQPQAMGLGGASTTQTGAGDGSTMEAASRRTTEHAQVQTPI